MHLRAANEPDFLQAIAERLSQNDEIFVLIEYSRAAGNKSFEFMRSMTALTERLGQLTPATRITVFMRPQLPLRGCVDNQFIEYCLQQIRDGSEFLVVETEPRNVGDVSWLHHEAGISHQELKDALEDSRGRAVAAGGYPQAVSDGISTITAYVPDSSGNVQMGVY
jgi:hypothetical protein